MSPAAAMIDVQAIAARTMLCTLSCQLWRATRTHKKETDETQKRHHSSAPRVLVTVCEHKALKDLGQLHAKAYTEHRRLSLPTVQDGMKMIPAARQLEHADMMRQLSDEHAAIVAQFLNDYPAEVAAAPARLNGLYDASMWPSLTAISAKFGFENRYLSCPTDGAWAEWLSESARAASEELRDRVREALERVRDRCKSDGKLFASVFEQLRDVVDLVPDLDLAGSTGLRAVAAAAAPLGNLNADALRDDANARGAAAAQAANILTMLGGVQ